MLTVYLFLIFAYFCSGISQEIPVRWYNQCVDHFGDPDCTQTFRQRYWFKAEYYVDGGPVFFQFGGQSNAEGIVEDYQWQAYAQTHNALLMVFEHRFYGESYPNVSDPNPDLSLLTTQQAIADVHRFVTYFRAAYTELTPVPWLAFGFSYSGALVSYFMSKYPNFFKAAIVSSAPLEAIYDFPSFTETVSQVIQGIDEDCYNSIQEAFSCMESVVDRTPCGNFQQPAQLLDALNFCNDIDFSDTLARQQFFYQLAYKAWISSSPADKAMHNCRILSYAPGTDSVTKYGAFLQFSGYAPNCSLSTEMRVIQDWISVRHEGLRKIRDDDAIISAKDDLSWVWQSCNELGFFASADPVNAVFGSNTWSSQVFANICAYYFGASFTPAKIQANVESTNALYGGKTATRKCTIYVNGMSDPWHSQGITSPTQTTPQNTVIFTPGGQHCDDILPANTQEMSETQQQINNQIGLYMININC